MKRILIVNWGTRDKDYVFKAAKRKGLDVYLASSNNYPDWVLSYVDKRKIIITNTYDKDELIQDVLRTGLKFDGITTFFEMNVLQTAYLAEALGLGFVPVGVVEKSSANKYKMRLATRGLRFGIFENANEGEKLWKKLKLKKGVIKPVSSGHSYGVVKVDSLKNFKRMFDLAQKQMRGNFDEWMKYWKDNFDNRWLLEEYVDGRMVSVDGIIQNKKIIFRGELSFGIREARVMLEEVTWIPGDLSQKEKEICWLETERVLEIIGLETGGFHCEMRLSEKKAVLIEVAVRLPGGQILDGYRDAYGVDLAGIYLDVAMGKKVRLIKGRNKYWVIQESMPFERDGRVVKISGNDWWQGNENFRLCHLASEGEIITNSGGIRRAKVFYQFKARNKQEIEEFRKLIRERLVVVVKKDWQWRKEELKRMVWEKTPEKWRRVLLGRGLFGFLDKAETIVKRWQLKFMR